MSTIDKISEIKDIFEDIAGAIKKKGVEVDECDSPKTYPTKILGITGDGSTIPLLFDADYEEGAEVAVDYEVNDEGIGIFHFTLARGPKGADGKDGTDGAHGADGKDGVDGTDIQFIFARTNNGTPDKPESDPDSDALPTGGNITWYSVPQGVDDDHIYEYVCKRVKDPTTKKWGEYSTPAIWAQGGKVGRDGNGIEYIFCLTDSENNVPTVPNSDPNNSEDKIKWPLVSGSFKGYDDPLTVLAASPCCWVSVRKQSINKVDGVDVQTWGKYSPASLGSKYSKDGIDGGGRTVFAYCASSTKPSKPQGGSWDPKTNTATAPYVPSGENVTWYLNPVSIEEGQHLYQSNASFDSTGAIQGEGSDPVRITGEDGVNGKDGESVQFIYRLIPNKSNFDLLSDWHSDDAHALDSDPTGNDKAPEKTDKSTSSKPGGNPVENGSELFWTICDTEGTDEPKGIDGVNYLIECACTRTKNSVTDETTGDKKEEWGPWSKPFLGAVGGEDGIDGTGVEYIYLVTPKTHVFYENGEEIIREITGEDLKLPTKADYQAYDDIHGTKYASELFKKPEFIPGHTDNNIFDILYHADNAGGTDEPRDVSQNQPIEWVAIRKKAVEDGEHTGEWGDFSTPVIWNKWVTDGTSFKTAFAFTRTDEDLTKVTVEGGKLYIPSGGSYKDPVPVNARVWLGDKSIDLTGHDTIPEGAGKVGMTSRLFSANEFVEVADSDWSIPTPMTDSSIMQIEFAQVYKDEKGEHEDVIPNPVSFQKYYEEATGERDEKLNNAESAGRDVEKIKGGYWNDGENISDPMWMAVCYQRNGKWTDGTVTRVKGERGTAGKNGTSVTILGSAKLIEDCSFYEGELQYLNNNQPALHVLQICDNGEQTFYDWNPDLKRYDKKSVHNNGDGYLIDKYLGVGDGDSFENVGQIKGDPGENAHLYIAFSNNAEVLDRDSSISIDLTAKTGKYIGYLTSSYEIGKEALENSLTYTYGTKGTGDDGWGYEQIYLLTKEVHTDNLIIDYDNGPLVPKRGESVSLDDGNTAGYLPFVDEQYEEYSKGSDDEQGMRWFDVPQSPTAEYPYCGVAHRNTSDWEWKGQWVYDKENPDASYYRAALYSRYVPDLGHLELDNDNLVVPLDGGNVDADFTATINLSFYYAGGAVYNFNDYYYRFDESKEWEQISTGELVINKDSELGAYIYFRAIYNGVNYYKNCTIRKVDNAYKLKVDSRIIRKDATYDPKEINCTVQKWSGDTWNDAETHIYYKVDNEEEKTYNEVFNCSEEQPQKNVRFYIKDSEYNILDFEDVAVVTDGTSAYHLQLSEDHVTVPLTSSGGIDEDYSGFDITATLYAGDIVLDNENIKYSYRFGDSEEVENVNNELITIKSELLAEKPETLTIIATRESTRGTKDVQIAYASIAYEMTVSKNIIRRDASTNEIVDTDDTIKVTIMKWSGTEWLAANDVTVNVQAGDVEDKSIEIYPASTNNGVASFEGITEFEGLAGIEFYITDNNGAKIAHENVGVVVNGEDGAWQEFIYKVFGEKQDSIADPTPMKEGVIDYSHTVNDKKYSDPEYVPDGGTDNPEDLTTAGQYQYVSVRKKVNNQWQAFSTPVIWSYKPFDGEDGEDAISVSFGSSPTIFLNENNLLASGNLNVSIGAMQGSKVLNINSVTFKSATYNESLLNNLSLNYSDGILSISGLDNSINDTGIITIFMEVNISGISSLIQTSLTIVVQKSGGQNAKQVSLSEDSVTVFKGVETTVTTTATFYDGSSQKEAAWFIDGVQTNTATSYTYKTEGSFSETTSIPITAKYNDVEYSKVFRINVVDTEDRYGIVLSPDVINISNNDTHNIEISVGKQSRNNEPQQLEELPNGFKLKLGTGELNGLETIISRSTSKNKEVTISLVQTSDGEEFTGDSETITLNRDPIVYSLTVSPEIILADNEGKCNTNIKVTFKAFEGGLDITDDYNPIIKYQKNGVEGNYSENGVLVTEVSSNGDTYTFSAYLNGIVVASRSVTASIGQGDPGPKGEQGKAPIIYPEGEWNSDTEYSGTGNLASYVYVEENGVLSYFVAYGSIVAGTDPTDLDNQTENPDGNNLPNPGKWVKMPKYNAIYADIGKFDTALVGSWVFYKDGMFSQEGIVEGVNGVSKYDNENVTGDQEDFAPEFTPNIKLDAKTGYASLCAGQAIFDTDTIKLGNYTTDGDKGTGISITADGTTIGNTIQVTNSGISITSDDKKFSIDTSDPYSLFTYRTDGTSMQFTCNNGLMIYGSGESPSCDDNNISIGNASLYVLSGESNHYGITTDYLWAKKIKTSAFVDQNDTPLCTINDAKVIYSISLEAKDGFYANTIETKTINVTSEFTDFIMYLYTSDVEGETNNSIQSKGAKYRYVLVHNNYNGNYTINVNGTSDKDTLYAYETKLYKQSANGTGSVAI